MATTNHPFLRNYKGSIDKTVVVKQYDKHTVLTSYPDRSKVEYTEDQRVHHSSFADAVAFAQSIINDPVKKAEYSKLLPKGKRLYNAAIQEYLNPQPVPFSRVKPPVKKKGKIAKENVLVKNYSGKKILSSKPDMSSVKRSASQKAEQSRFGQAVQYAQSVIADAQKKAAWQAKLPKGKRVFNAALQAFLAGQVS